MERILECEGQEKMDMSGRSLAEVPFCFAFAMLTTGSSALFGQAILSADGVTEAYTRIQGVLKSAPETPDCSHTAFGPHITQALDSELGKYVFVFHIHVTPDNDRCVAFDRQRLEIKTEGNASTPDYLKGFLNDSVTFRWKFKLPAGFQPSTSFTHIHQIKAYDGDDSAPIMTLTPRKGNPNSLQLINVNSKGVTTTLSSTPLAPFVGVWVEAYEKITYSSTGQYSIVIKNLSDGAILFSYSNANVDLWRNGTTVVRPKWGIYRSLNNADQLRDEQVRYDRFCLAKGTDDCLSDQDLPDFSVGASAGAAAVPPGGTASYEVNVASLRGFGENVALRVTGFPAAATASFSSDPIAGGTGSSSLRVVTSSESPPGNYTLFVSGLDGILSHVVTVPLVVQGVPGDVNGDGVVDCADLALARAAFGRQVGQPGYNPRADFNGDGVVNIGDLAFAAHQMPAGTKCQ